MGVRVLIPLAGRGSRILAYISGRGRENDFYSNF